MNNFYHRGSFGDIIYSLPSIRLFNKSNLILKNKYYFDFLYSFLNKQDYINNVYHLGDGKISWNDININLDRFRAIHRKELSKHLVDCHSEVVKLPIDKKAPWIENISKNYKFEIIINRTPRYHDKENINWNLLKNFEKRCGFIGTIHEFSIFKSLTNLNVEYLHCSNCLEIAEIINASKLFIGNQSLAYALAEGMKINRVLEVCYAKPNCMPLSDNGYISENLNLAIEKFLS